MSNVNATTPVPPHSLEAPAPAQPARPGIDIVFPLRKHPGGSPGKEGFCMKEVFNLDSQEYMMVLNSIREIAIACKLDMMKSITRQNQNILQRIYEKACDIFPGFRIFTDQDNHQWPVKAFLMVILKSASDTHSAIQWAKTSAKIATASPNTKARHKVAHHESAHRLVLAQSAAKCKAAEACVNTELGFQHAIEQVSQGLGEMSFKYDNEADQEMDYECGPVFGDAFLNHVPLSAHEPAQPSSPVPAPVHMPVAPPCIPLVPSAAALARQPPPIPSAATCPRPRQAEDSLDSAATSAPTATSATSAMSAMSATSATSAPVGPINIIPAPLAALTRLPPLIPPAASRPRPRPRPRQANGSSDLVPVPTPTPAPTLVPMPAPAVKTHLSLISFSVLM
ncbi:hypothetical protein FRC10_011986 [Ceratobasidium sp. 414]|nr:hypothetical protein FRC10_011986 [Ceratobasidium sp. 414]